MLNNIDINKLPSPCYLVDERLLEKNLKVLDYVQKKSGANIILALKGYSMFSTFPLVGKYLSGVTSSSLFEARLGYEEMGKQVHIYAAAYREDEFDEIMEYCDHIVFNSFNQWRLYRDKVKKYNNEHNYKKIECGLRINPEYSEIETDIYNPCFVNSRMGITLENFKEDELEGIDGLHFHTMCEQNSDTLERTLKVVEEKFGKYLYKMKWLNFGGGHHIAKEGYDVEKLINCINYMKDKYEVDIYLEPGEGVAINTGFLVSTVLDVIKNGMNIAILDTSAACHMPDVLEMPYRPEVINGGNPDEYEYTYRLGGPTCLSGDIIGDYSFKEPLKPGDKLVFCDMAHYSMVKNNTFNGINLPAIVKYSDENGIEVIRKFEYEDFKNRLS